MAKRSLHSGCPSYYTNISRCRSSECQSYKIRYKSSDSFVTDSEF